MIYGERVRLRASEREDIPTFVRWFNDPEVRQYLLMYLPMSRAKEEQWFEEHLKARDDFFFVIECRQGEEWLPIGTAGLHRVDWKNSLATLGISLGKKSFWNQGLGTDAVRTLVHFAFTELNLHRVQLEVYDFNPRARRCYEKVGFRLEGTRRQALYRQGCYHDIHIMGILREEFSAGASAQPGTKGRA